MTSAINETILFCLNFHKTYFYNGTRTDQPIEPVHKDDHMLGRMLCHTLCFQSQTVPPSITNNGCKVKIMAAEFKQWL